MATWSCRKHGDGHVGTPWGDEVPACSKCKSNTFVYDKDKSTKVADKPLTCTVDAAVAGWAEQRGDDRLDLAVDEIKKVGLAAGGLRGPIGGSAYDIHCGKASDYRYVGVAGETTFHFHAVYRHPKKGGKEFVAGQRVPAYG